MKKRLLLLFISLLCAFQGFAQNPDPELFKTWHLHVLGLDLINLVVEDVSPPIYPTLTITETLSFYGESACNTFSGTMSYDVVSELFEVGRPAFYAYVYDNGNGEQSVDTIGPWYPLLGLKNFPLNVPENDALNIAVYPNPVAETLFIASEGISIEKKTVYSIQGKLVLSENSASKIIDVSKLSEGLYFIEISSSKGKSVQKFVKN